MNLVWLAAGAAGVREIAQGSGNWLSCKTKPVGAGAGGFTKRSRSRGRRIVIDEKDYEKPEERLAGVVLRLTESAAEMVAQTVPAFESLATATGSLVSR